jgi:hypothetical protein
MASLYRPLSTSAIDKHVAQRLHRMELELLPHILRHILEIRFVRLRDDDFLDARAVCAEHLFLHATDRQLRVRAA